MNKKSTKSHVYVGCGFGLVILLLIGIIVLWKYNEYIREEHLRRSEQHQFEIRAIEMIIHSAHLRAITLYKMTTLHDPFELDDAYLEFQTHGENLMKHRDILASFNLDEEEKGVWNQIKSILNAGYKSQYQAIKFINESDYESATKQISTVVTPIQDDLQAKLDELLKVKNNRLRQEQEETKKTDLIIDVFIYLLSFICLALCVLTIIVTRRTARTEFDLAAQGYRIRSLYEVASKSHDSFDNQIEDTLRVGCELFNLEIGKLCEIDDEQQTNTVLNVVINGNFNTMLKKNMVLPLERTFCSIPFQEDRIVLLHKIATSEYRCYPCVEFANLGTYIAAPIYVHGIKYGTINFSSFKAKPRAFTEDDHDLLYLIGKFVSVILETKLSQEIIIEKKASDDANTAKSRFLSNMSHELRTPLNAIIGYSELVLENQTTLDQNSREDIKRIHKSGFHLLHLVNNVLDISKVEAGKMTVEAEEFELNAFLGNIVDLISPLVSDNNNVLRVHCNGTSLKPYTDLQKLKQILMNLISNAAKFTKDGEIHLSTQKIVSDGKEKLLIKVRDTGLGMNEEVQKIIFEEFVQDATHKTTQLTGTGLGLSICKSFCLLLGGEINVSSRLGEGSEFSVTIPMVYTSRPQTAAVQSV